MNLLAQAEAAVAPYLKALRIAALAVVALGLVFLGWWLRGGIAGKAQAKSERTQLFEQINAEQAARLAEKTVAKAQASAGDAANAREAKIDDDYQERLASAVAGRDSELGRVRKLWGQCETDRLSGSAAAAAEVAEQDRLRDASAARIVRAVELAQSERDEAIDRYEAVMTVEVWP